MVQTPCVFGLTDVRVATRVISFVQFWFNFFYVSFLITKYILQWNYRMNSSGKSDDDPSEYDELEFDMSTFSEVSGGVLIMYASYYLKRATYEHNLQNINFWMIINSIDFIISLSFTFFASMRTGLFDVFFSGIIVCAVQGYKLYIVYQYYTDEISSETVNADHHTSTQNNSLSNGDPVLPQTHVVDIGTETRTLDY